jgi:transposase
MQPVTTSIVEFGLLKHLAPHRKVHIVIEATGGYDKSLLDGLQAHGIAWDKDAVWRGLCG